MLNKLLVVGLVAYVAFKLSEFIPVLGFHKTTYNHYPGPCRSLPNIVNGSEDIELLPGDRALITTGLRFIERANENYDGVVTGVYVFDFNKPKDGARPVPINNFRDLAECDFHGISSWTDKQAGNTFVFVVNHLETESVVEIFLYDNKNNVLDHKETVGSGDHNVHMLNDVAAVGPRQFYATNYLYMRKKIEMNLLLKWGSVLFFDGSLTSIVASRLLLPNGISASHDGKYIYLSHISEREVITYARNDDNSLTINERTPLYTLPDNIYVEPDTGDLYVGCHPSGDLANHYLENPKQNRAPSQVLRLLMRDGKVARITEILANDGSVISGSSIAVYRKKQLLVGTVASTMLHCDVKHLS